LASIASSLSKFAADLRILQSPAFGEWSEPFGTKQVGSSAMPFKKNPINAEKVCSLARYVLALPAIALENASLSYLERTLDDSANKRVIIPEGFLAVDEILKVAHKLIDGLVVSEAKIADNLERYAPFAATEGIILEAVKNGADRQSIHEMLREISVKAWDEIQKGNPNPMRELLRNNDELFRYVDTATIEKLLDVKDHLGDAPARALMLVKKIEKALS
jgi:adenylosuccinate lyase